jgi:hypothetical protein
VKANDERGVEVAMLRLNQKPQLAVSLYLLPTRSAATRKRIKFVFIEPFSAPHRWPFPSYKGQSETGSLLPPHSRQPASTNKKIKKKIDDRSTSVQFA